MRNTEIKVVRTLCANMVNCYLQGLKTQASPLMFLLLFEPSGYSSAARVWREDLASQWELSCCAKAIKNTLISLDFSLVDMSFITMNMFIRSKSNTHRSAAENTQYHTKGPQEDNKRRVGLLGTFTVSATQSAPRNCFSRKYVVVWCRAA